MLFQETQHTEVLASERAEEAVRERFRGLRQDITAFSRVRYVGTRTQVGGETS